MGRSRWLLICALLLLTLPQGRADGGTTGTVHTEGLGPLSAMSGSGGFAANAPVSRPYWVSFGYDTPCYETRPEKTSDPADPDDDISVVGVRYPDGRFPPAKVRIFLRTVTPRQVRRHPDNRWVFDRFIVNVGHPRRSLSYGHRIPGHYSRQIAGYAVTRSCAEVTRDLKRLSRGRVPRKPVTTLVFAIKTGDKRASIHHSFVDYLVNNDARTLRINWTMAARAPRTAD